MMKTALLSMVAILAVCSSIWEGKAISGGMSNISETASVGSPYARTGEINLRDLVENETNSNDGEGVQQIMATIVDDPSDQSTWVERWDRGHPDPAGMPPGGWGDVAGSVVFMTYQIHVTWTGNDVHLQIFTDFPETGYGDGTPYGYPYGGLYQLADVAFDLNLDGMWDTGIPLIDHGAIPEDPGGENPPGYGLPANHFLKGKIYTVTAWFPPQDIHYYHWAYAGKYDMNDPKTPISWMRLGTQIGITEITYTDLGNVHPKYRIDIILKDINTSGEWDHFSIYWGTGNCANDVITGTVEGQGGAIPTFTQWGLMLFALFLTVSAFWVSKRRSRIQRVRSSK